MLDGQVQQRSFPQFLFVPRYTLVAEEQQWVLHMFGGMLIRTIFIIFTDFLRHSQQKRIPDKLPKIPGFTKSARA